VASAIAALDETCGTEVSLKIMDGAKHLWTGPAAIREVEMPPGTPQQMLLGLAFRRRLRPAELRLLRIA
jgi:hypothetical protein